MSIDEYNDRIIKAAYDMNKATPTDQQIVRAMVEKFSYIQASTVTLITLEALQEFKRISFVEEHKRDKLHDYGS